MEGRNALTDHEPPSFWAKIILTLVMVVVGLALAVGGVALGTAWFVPDEPTVTVNCDDDYTYTKGVDDTFTNDEGDVCVESTQETWQTASHTWQWWWPLDIVATFIVITVAAVLAILGMAVLIGFLAGVVVFFAGPVATWADDEYLPDLRKPERVVWRNL